MELRQLQVGLVNYVEKMNSGFQVGLVNIIRNSDIPVLPIFNFLFE